MIALSTKYERDKIEIYIKIFYVLTQREYVSPC